jgi:hypothetical protein
VAAPPLWTKAVFDSVDLTADMSERCTSHELGLSNNAAAIMMDVALGEQSLALQSASLRIADLVTCVLGLDTAGAIIPECGV